MTATDVGRCNPIQRLMEFGLSWYQGFFDPIILPGRKPLITLRDAAHYIMSLPEAEQQAPEWQTALFRQRFERRDEIEFYDRQFGKAGGAGRTVIALGRENEVGIGVLAGPAIF